MERVREDIAISSTLWRRRRSNKAMIVNSMVIPTMMVSMSKATTKVAIGSYKSNLELTTFTSKFNQTAVFTKVISSPSTSILMRQ